MRHFCSAWVSVAACVLLLRGLPAQSSAAQQSSAAVVPAAAVVSPVAAPASMEDALGSLFRAAGVVFTGEVIAIRRAGDAVEVRLRVDDAVRGVSPAAVYTLREWAGLWTGQARYAVGERLLMLLYAPSAMGYSSPVGGLDGAIPVHGGDVGGTVDLRWVAARMLQPHPAVAPAGTGSPASSAVPAGSLSSDAMARADRGVVMGLLHAWQGTTVASR